MKLIEKMQHFFETDPVLDASNLLLLQILLINIAVKFLLGMYSSLIGTFCFFASLLALYLAFRAHNKNVQKGLLGAVLMWYFSDELNYAVNGILLDPEGAAQYSGFCGVTYLVCSLITLVLFTVLFVNHFLICGDHKSRPVNVGLNFTLVWILSLLSLISAVVQVPVVMPSMPAVIESLSWHLALVAFLFTVASYEAHFEMWKEKREQNA